MTKKPTGRNAEGRGRTLVLHIGWPKTGTTSLQEFFGINREIIKEKAGIYYPRTGIRGSGHGDLGASVGLKSSGRSALWKMLGEELRREAGWRQVLISAEVFQNCDAEQAQAMLAALPAFERMVFVAYVRQPDE